MSVRSYAEKRFIVILTKEWRRWESNPGPQVVHVLRLHVYSVI